MNLCDSLYARFNWHFQTNWRIKITRYENKINKRIEFFFSNEMNEFFDFDGNSSAIEKLIMNKFKIDMHKSTTNDILLYTMLDKERKNSISKDWTASLCVKKSKQSVSDQTETIVYEVITNTLYLQ